MLFLENVLPNRQSSCRKLLSLVLMSVFSFTFLTGCGGGGDSSSSTPAVSQDDNQNNSSSNSDNSGNNSSGDNNSGDDNSTDPVADIIYEEPKKVARFLNQATFGASMNDIDELTNESLSEWFLAQQQVTPNYLLPVLEEMNEYSIRPDEISIFQLEATTIGFWRNSILGEDQLRQRIAFALSELLVVSNGGGEVLTDNPSAVAYYQDLLISHAFGNYRELLEAVTYSPAMGYYLTYLGSEKGDPETGRMPDENYARELLQLFTIGVVALNQDGSVKLDSQGKAIETYSNQDITGLARVFTGLNINWEILEESDDLAFASPMQTFEESHSSQEKHFLGFTIPENTDAKTSITMALDHIFAHPNVAPFISEQLIQRFVSSNPTPEYIERVANAFDAGVFQLPNGTEVGDGRRGDLSATVAAVLFDEYARDLQGETSGKIREPIIRFTHWARAFNVAEPTGEYQHKLWESSSDKALAQHPYRSPSVFNFFRPGYVAPGTLSGNQGLKAPEMQLMNASSIAGYSNFMTYYIFAYGQYADIEQVEGFFEDEGINFDAGGVVRSFIPDYQGELNVADNTEELVARLNLLLTNGDMTEQTVTHLQNSLELLPADSEEQKQNKIKLAVLMVILPPDYLVQM